MKKNDKKTLSLSRQTLRNLSEVTGAQPRGNPSATLNYSVCWTCNRDGCAGTSSVVTTTALCF